MKFNQGKKEQQSMWNFASKPNHSIDDYGDQVFILITINQSFRSILQRQKKQQKIDHIPHHSLVETRKNLIRP